MGVPRGSLGLARPAGALRAGRAVARGGRTRWGGLSEGPGLGWGLGLGWVLAGLCQAERGVGHGGILLCFPFLLLLLLC